MAATVWWVKAQLLLLSLSLRGSYSLNREGGTIAAAYNLGCCRHVWPRGQSNLSTTPSNDSVGGSSNVATFGCLDLEKREQLLALLLVGIQLWVVS